MKGRGESFFREFSSGGGFSVGFSEGDGFYGYRSF